MKPAPRCRLRVIFAGDGSQRRMLCDQIKAYGLREIVHVAGYRSDIHDYMAACDIVALPSLQEGMPLALLEAQQLGKAVIASELPGTRDAPDPIRLVTPADPVELARMLARILQEPLPTAAVSSVIGRDRTHEAMVEDYMCVYEGLRSPSGA